MPSRSKKQRNFFRLVHAVQKGGVCSKKISKNVKKAARQISPDTVSDFLENKNISRKQLMEIIECIKNLRYDVTGTSPTSPAEPMLLEDEPDDPQSPIAKTFQQKGDFEQYVQRFRGLELKPKEIESIDNYKTKPVNKDKFKIRYESVDDFNNNSVTVIKKLREGNELVFTAFQINKPQTPPEQEKEEEENFKDTIVVNKSISFRDEISGGKILNDLLLKLDI